MKLTKILLVELLGLGVACMGCETITCGEGTRLSGNTCVAVDADVPVDADEARHDADEARHDADEARHDADVPQDLDSDLPIDSDLDVLRPGDDCDPNYFPPQCSVTGLMILYCERGEVVGQECPWGQVCVGAEYSPVCVPEDAERCDESFIPRCNEGRAEQCSLAGVVYSVDCTADDRECALFDGLPQCIGADVEFCDADEAPGTFCTDETHFRTCSRTLSDEWIWHTLLCPYERICIPARPGIEAGCVPESAELCDPYTYVPECTPPDEPCPTCGPRFEACTTAGFLNSFRCRAGDECVLRYDPDAMPSLPNYRISCKQPGAEPCDLDTYEGWCDGNMTVNCSSGFIRVEDCGNPEEFLCTERSDMYFPDAVCEWIGGFE